MYLSGSGKTVSQEKTGLLEGLCVYHVQGRIGDTEEVLEVRAWTV